MPYTMKDFRREYLAELPPEERLKGISLDERLRGFSADEIKAYLKKLEEAQKPGRPPPKSRGRRKGRSPS